MQQLTKTNAPLVLLFSFLMLSFITAQANTIKVPEDHPVIQEALDAAVEGDTVLVGPGVYEGAGNSGINFKGKVIVLISEAGAESTVINVANESYGFIFNSGESQGTVLRGFTIHGASNAGISVYLGAGLSIEDCIFENNTNFSGKGIYLNSSQASIRRCVFRNNGGGSSEAGGIYARFASNSIIENCLFINNRGRYAGAVFCSGDSPLIVNCTMVNNESEDYAGGVSASDGLLKLRNCIVWHNSSQQGLAAVYSQTYDITYSNLENIWPDVGNISIPPVFQDTFFHLKEASPGVDAGRPSDDYQKEPQPNGERINMGRYGNTAEAAPGVNDQPIIISLSLGIGPPDGGAANTITGKNFGQQSGKLQLGGQEVAIQSWSPNQILFDVPPHAPGKVDLIVTRTDGAVDTLTYAFTYEGSRAFRVPQEFPKIQEALNAANHGDTVLVAPGVYGGPGNINLNFQGKAILLASEAGAAGTVIDATGADYGFYFYKQETLATVVRGFTVRSASYTGMFINIGSSPTIEDCIFENHRSHGSESIYIYASQAVIRGCVFRNNSATGSETGGIYARNSPDAIIENCLFTNNRGRYAGAIYSNGDSPLIINCTVADNESEEYAGGVTALNGILKMRNCIVWDNFSETGTQSVFSDQLAVTYSNIHGGTEGLGNIDSNPIFIDPYFGDYHLFSSSPSIDTGDPTDNFDLEPQPNGGRINMGYYGNTPEAASFLAVTKILDFNLSPSCETEATMVLQGVYFGDKAGAGTLTVGGKVVPTEKIAAWSNERIEFTAAAADFGSLEIVISSIAYGEDTLSPQELIIPDYQFVSGEVSGIWSADCPSVYILTGDVVIPEGMSLTIEPGVKVLTAVDSSRTTIRFRVLGDLVAVGTPSDSILFSVMPGFEFPGAWQGLELEGANQARIAYSRIEYADNAIEVHGNDVIENCVIQYNKTSGITWQAFSGEFATGTLQNCLIQNNEGWGVICDASCSTGSSSASPLISSNIIQYNNGGGIYVEGVASLPPPFVFASASQSATASPTITRNLIRQNKGWALECYGVGNWADATPLDFRFRGIASPIIHNNVMILNQGALKASAPFFDSEYSSWLSFSRPELSNNTFWLDTPDAILVGDSAIVSIANSIFWSDLDLNVRTQNGGLTEISYSNFSTPQTGNGNISENPQFVDPVQGDYRVFASSPCIDGGNNERVAGQMDFLGRDRIADGNGDGTKTVDIGAFEYALPVIASSPKAAEDCVGTAVIFKTEAEGDELTYQWLLNDAPVTDANHPQLILDPVSVSDQGEYRCRVSDELGGVVFSEPAELIVLQPLEFAAIVTTPDSVICEGESLSFDLTSTDGITVDQIDWQLNGESVVSNTASFQLTQAGNGDQIRAVLMTQDYCIANPEAVSNAVTITVNPLPVVEFPPLDTLTVNDDPLNQDQLGATPINGRYSGPGVTENIFYPEEVGPGEYEILYTYTDTNGCLDTAAQIVIVTEEVTSLGNPADPMGLRVFPNPTQQGLKIDWSEAFPVTVVLITLEGKRLFRRELQPGQTTEMDLSKLPSGTYFLRVDKGLNSITFRKIIKQ